MSKVLELKGHEVYFIRRMQNEEILNRFNELAELQNNPIRVIQLNMRF